MIEGLHKLFSKKGKTKQYGYEGEYGDIDIDTEAEDMFMEESYMNHYDVEDEFFD